MDVPHAAILKSMVMILAGASSRGKRHDNNVPATDMPSPRVASIHRNVTRLNKHVLHGRSRQSGRDISLRYSIGQTPGTHLPTFVGSG